MVMTVEDLLELLKNVPKHCVVKASAFTDDPRTVRPVIKAEHVIRNDEDGFFDEDDPLEYFEIFYLTDDLRGD